MANLTLGSFQVSMPAAEAEVALEAPGNVPGAENPSINSAVVRAMKGNTGVIYVGQKGVLKTTGFELAAGDAISVDIQGLGKMFAVGTKENDKLCVFFTGP